MHNAFHLHLHVFYHHVRNVAQRDTIANRFTRIFNVDVNFDGGFVPDHNRGVTHSVNAISNLSHVQIFPRENKLYVVRIFELTAFGHGQLLGRNDAIGVRFGAGCGRR